MAGTVNVTWGDAVMRPAHATKVPQSAFAAQTSAAGEDIGRRRLCG